MQSYIIYIGVLVGILVVGVVIFILVRVLRKKRTAKKTGALTQKLQVEKIKSDIVLNSIEDAVVVVNAQQVIQVFNPAGTRLTGWPQKEATGLDHHAVFKLIDQHGAPYTDNNNPLSLAFSQARTFRDNNAVLVSRNNSHIPVDITVSPLLGENQLPSGVVGIFKDVSQQRLEEQKRGEFISTASHEMRTPVAAIEGYLALAMNDKVTKIDPKAREYLTKAHGATKHLGDLFRDLLTSAKVEDGRIVNHPAVIELGKFMERITEDLRFVAQKKGLQLEFIMGTPAGNQRIGSNKVIQPFYYSKVDPNRLREVITNLFDNAVKYTPAGKITLAVTGDSNIVQISVKDTGGGIPADDLPHLFQKFYRVDNSATRTIGGTGLGLFICRKIIELYNGRIWVESQQGKGSTFFINLPRLTAQQAQSQKTEITPTQSDHITPESYMNY